MPKVMWTKAGVCEKMEQSHTDRLRGVAITPLEWSLQMINDIVQW